MNQAPFHILALLQIVNTVKTRDKHPTDEHNERICNGMPVCDNTSSYDSPDDFERKDDSNVANWQGNPIRSNVGPPGNQPVVTPVNPPAQVCSTPYVMLTSPDLSLQFRKHRSFDTDHVAQNESIDGSNPKGVVSLT